MLNKLTYGGVVLAAITTVAAPAMAQDAPADWSGPYVGGALGYAVTDGGGDEVVQQTDGTQAPSNCNGRAVGGTTAAGCEDDEDGTAWSGHIGYDRQMGNFVVGAVVEAGRTDVKDYVSGFDNLGDSYTFSRDIDWNADARLRAGYSLGSTLIYGTGGLAYADVDNRFSDTSPVVFTDNDEASEDMWGYTVGGGVERKVADNFSIGLLYKYTNYGKSDYQVNSPAGNLERTEDFDTHSAQVTSSFRF